MPEAARSKLCSSVSVWVGVFARIAMSSASVIVFAGYLLLLFFVSSKPFSLILSIDVLSTKSRQMIKRYGASVSSCSTPALHQVNVLSLWCFYRESLLLLRSLLVSRMLVGFVPSSLCEGLGKVDKK